MTALGSISGLTTAGDLGPIDRSTLPEAVRNGSKADQERYTAALGFEKLLVTQLAKQLAETTKPDGSGEGDGDEETSGSSAATESYRSMLPDALAGAVMQAGGLGIAQSIYQQLPSSTPTPADATAGAASGKASA